MSTVFPNTREGRNRILDEIAKMVARGYSREDIKNRTITMKKTVKGKVCSESHIVVYTFHPSKVEIHKADRETFTGVARAKKMLYGWSSPKIEVSNAVKAGLLNEVDEAILKKNYADSDWCKIG